jgi:hypothetical protein
LVERNLAKVEVAGPSPVSRSKPVMLEYAPLLQYLSGSGVFVLNIDNVNTGAVPHPSSAGKSGKGESTCIKFMC